MRWVTFTVLFLLAVFSSFWVYVWSWKKEIIQNTVNQACPPLKCSIESVEFSNFTALTCKNVTLSDNNSDLFHAPIVSLTTSTPAWLFWFLVPSTDSLEIEHATIHLSKTNHMSFSPPVFPVSLDIKTLYVVYDDETTRVFQHLSGDLQELVHTISSKNANNATLSENQEKHAA